MTLLSFARFAIAGVEGKRGSHQMAGRFRDLAAAGQRAAAIMCQADRSAKRDGGADSVAGTHDGRRPASIAG